MQRLGVCLIALCAAEAADWNQWGGPNRSFQLPAGTKAASWPAGGPKQLWTKDLGDGYSSMVKSGNALYTMYRRGPQDVVIAIDPANGNTVWETAIDAPHLQGMNVEAGPGPHSTPLIVGGRLFATTVAGQLAALDLKTGQRLWSRELWKDLKGTFLDRGYASSPLAFRDFVIVPVGGPGRALMAFRQKDGSAVWSKGDVDNAYSSPILIRAGGKDHLVSFMAKQVIGADPSTGDVLWNVRHQTMYDINAATPVWCEKEGVLVVSSGYDGGSRGVRIGAAAAELWSHKRLRVHHTNMACADGVVYGSSGDFGPAPFSAVEAKTGAVLWQNRAFSKASFVLAGPTMFLVDDDGSVAMASVSRQGLKVLGEAPLLRANAWTAPLVDEGRMYVRDRHKLIALSLN